MSKSAFTVMFACEHRTPCLHVDVSCVSNYVPVSLTLSTPPMMSIRRRPKRSARDVRYRLSPAATQEKGGTSQTNFPGQALDITLFRYHPLYGFP
jgi:hypothetical protein